MSKLDLVIAQMRTLPEPEQNRLAGLIAALLTEPQATESLLSDAEWAAIAPTLDSDAAELPHADVAARIRAQFPA
jgi:hypothetical protein